MNRVPEQSLTTATRLKLIKAASPDGVKVDTAAVIDAWNLQSNSLHRSNSKVYALPEGWRVIVRPDNSGHKSYYIVDSVGCRRAILYYGFIDNRTACGRLVLCHRFSIRRSKSGTNPYYVADRSTSKEVSSHLMASPSQESLIEYLNKFFPEYKDPLAYWSK